MGNFNAENRRRSTNSAVIRVFYINRRLAEEDVESVKDLPVE